MEPQSQTTTKVESWQDVVGVDMAEEIVEEMLEEDKALTSVWVLCASSAEVLDMMLGSVPAPLPSSHQETGEQDLWGQIRFL